MHKVTCGPPLSAPILYIDGPLEYLNFDKLIFLSREAGFDVVIKDMQTNEETMRIGKGFALGHNS